jgi:tRNA G18 (ribose-2'-O)-methylase SpoU
MSSLNRVTIDDPRLEPYRHLKVTNRTRWSRQFIVEGEKLVRRLLASRLRVSSILVDEQSIPLLPTTLPDSAEVLVLPDGAVESIVGFNFHRGMLACAERPAAIELSSIVDSVTALRGSVTPVSLVVCPDVDDPENLGAILRIAAAFGVDGAILGGGCPDHLSRRVLRVSMGAALRIPIVRSENLDHEFDELARLGFETVATVAQNDAEELAHAAGGPRLAIVLGNEGHGLAPRWIARCSRRVTIGMPGGVDSLNVAVAAGICLYHFSRNRS